MKRSSSSSSSVEQIYPHRHPLVSPATPSFSGDKTNDPSFLRLQDRLQDRSSEVQLIGVNGGGGVAADPATGSDGVGQI
ncbi:hypothetical protein HanIR_Chr04g0181301 [Helianthus annuus]|nr:hypothetical protein HanIR_Chr04g0181301 [Helianthus annuus]